MDTIKDFAYLVMHYDYFGFFQNVLSWISLEFFLYAMVVYFFVVWIAVLLWVTRDIMKRTHNWLYQIICIFTVLFWTPLGVFLYLIIRPGKTLLEKYYDEDMYGNFESEYESEVAEEIETPLVYTCFSCHKGIEKSFHFCPYCSVKLKKECVKCCAEIQANWNTCPFCWEDQKSEGSHTTALTDEKKEIFKPDDTKTFESSDDGRGGSWD